jgi:hypothetical protein
VKDALISACRDWQTAADWPPEVRLGGHATELRHRSQDLHEALTGAPLNTMGQRSRQDALESALRLAVGVGNSHEAALTRVVTGRELWIVAQALGPSYLTRHPGVHRTDWVLDPGTNSGTTLLQAAHRANNSLKKTTDELASIHLARMPGLDLPGTLWETVAVEGTFTRCAPTAASLRTRTLGR